jgi:hypothetical protein
MVHEPECRYSPDLFVGIDIYPGNPCTCAKIRAIRKEVIEAFIETLWTLIDKRTMQEDHRCVDGELSMECDAHRGYDKAINEVRNAIKSARRAAIRGEGEHA